MIFLSQTVQCIMMVTEFCIYVFPFSLNMVRLTQYVIH